MEGRVTALLLARQRAGEPPASAPELLTLLALPRTEKSRLNQLLYKTCGVLPLTLNPLGLPRQYRLVRTETTPPLWSAVHRGSDPNAAPAVRVAWAAYELIAAHPGTPVSVEALLCACPDAPSLEAIAELVCAHALTDAERVDLAPPATLTLCAPPPPERDTRVVLDCDTVTGPMRDHAQCVVLGMAILECAFANPGRAVVLRTKNPGTHAVLRSVLKTNEYARTLDLTLAPLPSAQ